MLDGIHFSDSNDYMLMDSICYMVYKLFNPHMVKVILVTFVLKGGKTTPRVITASRLARNKIPTATPMFSGSNFSMVLSITLRDETGSQKSSMAAEIL